MASHAFRGRKRKVDRGKKKGALGEKAASAHGEKKREKRKKLIHSILSGGGRAGGSAKKKWTRSTRDRRRKEGEKKEADLGWKGKKSEKKKTPRSPLLILRA